MRHRASKSAVTKGNDGRTVLKKGSGEVRWQSLAAEERFRPGAAVALKHLIINEISLLYWAKMPNTKGFKRCISSIYPPPKKQATLFLLHTRPICTTVFFTSTDCTTIFLSSSHCTTPTCGTIILKWYNLRRCTHP